MVMGVYKPWEILKYLTVSAASVLLAPHEDGTKLSRRCNHTTLVLGQPLDRFPLTRRMFLGALWSRG